MRSVNVLGVRVDAVTLEEAVEAVLARVRARRRGDASRESTRPWLVVTPNPEIVMSARANPELRGILNLADLALADGVGLLWAARRQGEPLPGRVTGVDLVARVLVRGAREGLRVFFLGSRPGVADEAASRSAALHPGLVVAGTHHGYFRPEDDEVVARLVARSGAELVIVGLGSPRQETWLARQARVLGDVVALPVGGALDVLSGRVRRTPAWVARLGLEWLSRLLTQPSRWRRAPVLGRFVLAVLTAKRGDKTDGA